MNEHTTSTASQGASSAPGRKQQGESCPDPLPACTMNAAGAACAEVPCASDSASHAWQATLDAKTAHADPSRKAKRAARAEGGRPAKSVREYKLGEEIFNAVSHGVGAALAVAAIPISIVVAVSHGGGVLLAAALIYTITMLLEYLASTLYHALTAPRAKRVFKVIDHSFIYLFIAGSYTPYCLVTLANDGGGLLCAVVWALAILGVAIEAFWVFRPRWISAVIYLILGWCVVWFLPPVIENLATPGLVLLAAGGLCYTVGSIFYVLKKVPYMHSVFHLWVLAGSVLQFLSIVLYVL